MKYQTVLNRISDVENYLNKHKMYITNTENYKIKLNELKILAHIKEVERMLKDADNLIDAKKYSKADNIINSADNILKNAKKIAMDFKILTFNDELFDNLPDKIKLLNKKIICERFNIDIDNIGKINNIDNKHENLIVEEFPSALYFKYKPLDKLGKGGIGNVFKVKRKSNGKIIALKIPKDEGCNKYIQKEYNILKELCHEYIVKTYGCYKNPIPHIELEYIEGCYLSGKKIDRLKNYPKPMDKNKVFKLILNIAKGLSYIHGKNHIHGDINPSNILLTGEFHPKIIDFNIAKDLGNYSNTKGYTPYYAAPEQIHGWKTDKRTDIYQLGLIFCECLTGKNPGKEFYAMLKKQVESEESLYSSKLKEVIEDITRKLSLSHDYNPIFHKLLAYHKKDRYSTIDEFIYDLESITNEPLKTNVEKNKSSKINKNSEFKTGYY